MHIIIDGCDGCGKTTLTDKLAKQFSLDKIIMTRYGWKDFQSYYQKAALDNVVSDRSFISERVYSKLYNRQSSITKELYDALLSLYYKIPPQPWLFVILTASADTIMKRIEQRGVDTETRNEIMRKIELYLSIYEEFKTDNILYLDTTVMTEDDVFNKVKEFVYEYQRQHE